MLANLTVDQELLQTAMTSGRSETIDLDTQNTKDTIVEAALREYIQRRQHIKQAVMVGAEAADDLRSVGDHRGDVIDGETAIAALREKINTWRNEAS